MNESIPETLSQPDATVQSAKKAKVMTQRLPDKSARFDLLIGLDPVTREAERPTPGQISRLPDRSARLRAYENGPKAPLESPRSDALHSRNYMISIERWWMPYGNYVPSRA